MSSSVQVIDSLVSRLLGECSIHNICYVIAIPVYYEITAVFLHLLYFSYLVYASYKNNGPVAYYIVHSVKTLTHITLNTKILYC